MRWDSKSKYTRVGSTRAVSRYLWVPKKIDGEWRWLEKVIYIQTCISVGTLINKWKDTEWSKY